MAPKAFHDPYTHTSIDETATITNEAFSQSQTHERAKLDSSRYEGE